MRVASAELRALHKDRKLLGGSHVMGCFRRHRIEGVERPRRYARARQESLL
jgi:hypothetical protein